MQFAFPAFNESAAKRVHGINRDTALMFPRTYEIMDCVGIYEFPRRLDLHNIILRRELYARAHKN